MPCGQETDRHPSVNDISSYFWKSGLMAIHKWLAGSSESRVAGCSGPLWNLQARRSEVGQRPNKFFYFFFFLGQCGVRLLLTEDNSISVPWLRACNFTHDAFKVSYVGLLDKLDSDRWARCGDGRCSGSLDVQQTLPSVRDATQHLWNIADIP